MISAYWSGAVRRFKLAHPGNKAHWREYEFGVGTIAGVAKKLGVHRRMVREAVARAMQPRRKAIVCRAWKIEPVKEITNRVTANIAHTDGSPRETANDWEHSRTAEGKQLVDLWKESQSSADSLRDTPD